MSNFGQQQRSEAAGAEWIADAFAASHLALTDVPVRLAHGLFGLQQLGLLSLLSAFLLLLLDFCFFPEFFLEYLATFLLFLRQYLFP